MFISPSHLTLIPLTWRIWWANNASKWQMGFNSAFKGLISLTLTLGLHARDSVSLKRMTDLTNLKLSRKLNSVKLSRTVDRNIVATGWTVRGDILHTCPYRTWGPPNLLYNGYRIFPAGNAAGVWRWPPTPFGAEVKEKVELYFHSSPGLHGRFYGKFYFLGLPVMSIP